MLSHFHHRIVPRLFVAAVGSCLLPVLAVRGQEGAAPGVGSERARATVEAVPKESWNQERAVRVRGGDPYTRVKFHVFAEELRGDVRRLLFRVGDPMRDEFWNIPIEVTLWGSFRDVHFGPDVRKSVELTADGRFTIRVEVKLHDRFDEDAFQLEFIRALLIEQILAPYSSRPGGFEAEEVRPPEWIAHGIDQMVRHRRGGRPSASYRGFLESGQLLKPAELLSLEDAGTLDPVRHAIFRASASAMVEALLGQPGGNLGLRGLLGDLGRASPPTMEVLLRQHFPAFREMEQGLEKWWALELAALGQQQEFEYLGREETERLLTEAITLRFDATPVATPVEGEGRKGFFSFLKPQEPAAPPSPEAFVGTVDQFEQYLKRSGAKDRLAGVHDQLQHLKRVGFPLYRPVFIAYENAVQRLAKGDTKDLAAEFASIAEMRARIRETLVRAQDYLNHFEAARAPQRSGAFDGYLEMRQRLDRMAAPPRNDAITRHLDALEREFQ